MNLAEFNDLVKESFELQNEIKLLEDGKLKDLKSKLNRIDRAILTQLDENQMNSFKSQWGTVSRKKNYSVGVPKTREDKEKLFDFLRDKGEDVFYSYVTVNSQSIKALYMSELELAKEEGNLDFELPGTGVPLVMESITRRKK